MREIDAHVRAEILRLFVANAPMATVSSVINVLVIGYVMQDRVASWVIRSWVIGQIVLSLLRVTTTLLYKRRAHGASDTNGWMRLFSSGVVAQALAWSFASVVFFYVGDELARTFIAVMIAGMVAGGVSVLSPLRRAASAWVLLLVLPEAMVCFYFGGIWSLFGICALMFTMTQLVAVGHAHTGLVQNARMAFENTALVRSLSQTNLELTDARDGAMRAAQVKSDFLANMSHEIRTPMTAILGYVDLLRDDAVELEQVQPMLDIIQRNGKHLLSVINDILDLSRLESGKLDVEMMDCAPERLMDDIVALMRERAADKGIAFEVEMQGEVPASIRTDPTRLRQILLNLISNAIKFTPRGFVRMTAQGVHGEDTAHLCFEVEDSGIGIPEDKHDAVFQPFAQADTSTTRRFGGTGLGLSISSRLAELLGGRLELVRSVPGGGSTFALYLPIAVESSNPTPHAGASSKARQAELSVSPASEAPLRGHLSGRILLAEDSIDNQRLVSFMLTKAGLRVDVAENGRIALERVEVAREAGTPYDVILMDMQMPEVDGYEATRTLRSQGYLGTILAFTAHAMSGERERCIHAGCDGYITKPIDRRELLRTLERSLSQRKADTALDLEPRTQR